jgi:uncharacterized membrane protein YgdD (TMEM256/DUF423 family)
MNTPTRAIVAIGGLIGAAGVALAAAAAHGPGAGTLSSAALICLANAPALLALAALPPSLRLMATAACVIAAGTTLFAAEIVLGAFTGQSLFPMAAPAGGLTMIGGWLIAAIGGVLPPRS